MSKMSKNSFPKHQEFTDCYQKPNCVIDPSIPSTIDTDKKKTNSLFFPCII